MIESDSRAKSAAIAAALLSVLSPGDELLLVDSAYDPTRNFCEQVLKPFGVETLYYDPTIGAGIAKAYAPEELVGKLVVVVANLAPRTMKIGKVELLGHKGAVKWVQDAASLRVDLPAEKPCGHAIAFRVTGAL